MRKVLEARVRTTRLKLSSADSRALKHPEKYDWILFSSKNAAQYFVDDIKKSKFALPRQVRVAAVGDTTARVLKSAKIHVDVLPPQATAKDMVRSLGGIRTMRILFPRAAIAPNDILRTMRKKGAVVRAIPFYTTKPEPLTALQRKTLLSGGYAAIYFKSPSGVRGLVNQFRPSQRKAILKVKAECIGPTTARAAKALGFSQVKDLRI